MIKQFQEVIQHKKGIVMLNKCILHLFTHLLVVTSFCSPCPPRWRDFDIPDDWGNQQDANLNWAPRLCDPCNPWDQDCQENTDAPSSAPRPCDPLELENQLSRKIQEPLANLQSYIQENNLDINSTFSFSGDTILIMPTHGARLDIVRWLISVGAHVNISNDMKESPLHEAVREGNEAILQLLLAQENITISQPNENGFTPLMLAVDLSHVRIAEILKEAGAEEPSCPVCLENLTDLYRNGKSLRRACANSEHHRLCSTCYEDVNSHAPGRPRCPLCRADLL